MKDATNLAMDKVYELISSSQEHEFFGQPDTARLMGMIVALGGEVFVLKAQVERLTRALEKAGALKEAELAEAGQSKEMAAWIATEEKAFGEALLRPFVQPDLAAASPFTESKP